MVKLVVTVDVEEDQWGIAQPHSATVSNVGRLPILQQLFNEFGIVPTYLLTYPVASDRQTVSLLRKILVEKACEIGMHCHPWNTPPYKESLNKHNSLLCNLPPPLQFEKLQMLHDAIQEGFDITPIAFRSGRWGFDAEVAKNILRLGYRIDTSMTPYTSWAQVSGPDFSCISPRPYTIAPGVSSDRDSAGILAEIPVTIGYLHGDFNACATIARRLGTDPFRKLKIGGLLSRLHVLRKVWLSPEMETAGMMLQLVRQMKSQGYEVLNLVFHSSALMRGCGPFIRTNSGEQRFLETLRTFLNLVKKEAVTFSSLSQISGLPAVLGALPTDAAMSRHNKDSYLALTEN